MAIKKPPKPEDFDPSPAADLSIREQVSRSNLQLATKAAILAALERPSSKQKKSRIYEAVKARTSDARELTGTTLAELEKVVQEALRATLTKVFYQKVYRENGKLWKVVPKPLKEPDHYMRLKVVELFMRPAKAPQKAKKPSKGTGDISTTASRLRDRELELEGSILDGNGNGNE